jgi:hypothetical protein
MFPGWRSAASSGVAMMRWSRIMATEVISDLTAHSSEAATQRRNDIARYRLQLLARRDAMANGSLLPHTAISN